MNMKKFLVPAFIAASFMANADEVKLSNLLTNTKFTADTRLNYISKDDDAGNKENSDLRLRFRLNFDSQVNEFASVKGRVRLTNDYDLGDNTVKGTSEKASLFTDILYFDYKKGNHELLAGRYTPFYKISNFFLTDGEKEGVGYLGKFGNTDLRAGYLLTSNADNTEITDKSDIMYLQAVHSLKFENSVLKLEAAGMAIDQPKGSTSDDSKGFMLGADYTQNLSSVVEYAQIRGEYIQTDDDGENKGYSMGVVFGSKKIEKAGDWKAEVEYKEAGENNTIAPVKNRDQKNIKLWAQTYIAPKMDLEVEYNIREKLKGPKTVDYSELQVSINHKF